MWSRRRRPSVIAEAPRDRDLVRLYWPPPLRPAFDALLNVDEAMATVAAAASEPLLSAIKLAWWRENLEQLDVGPPTAEPRLQAAARELLPRGISGADLAALEEGWALLLQADDQQASVRGLASRGLTLFGLASRLLGLPMDQSLENAAQEFAAADLWRRGMIELPPLEPGHNQPASPRKARPLTALAALARRDLRRGGPPFEPQATPPRAWTLIRHRFTGR